MSQADDNLFNSDEEEKINSNPTTWICTKCAFENVLNVDAEVQFCEICAFHRDGTQWNCAYCAIPNPFNPNEPDWECNRCYQIHFFDYTPDDKKRKKSNKAKDKSKKLKKETTASTTTNNATTKRQASSTSTSTSTQKPVVNRNKNDTKPAPTTSTKRVIEDKTYNDLDVDEADINKTHLKTIQDIIELQRSIFHLQKDAMYEVYDNLCALDNSLRQSSSSM